MYESPVKSPFPSRSTGRGEAAVNNHYIARGGKGASGEKGRKSPLLSPPFFLSLCFLLTLHDAFIFACFPLPPSHRSYVCLNLLCFLALSILLLSFLCACRTVAERKVELDASLTELSFETCRRFCLCWSELLQLTGSSSSKTSTVCHRQLWPLIVQSIQDSKPAPITPFTTYI